MEQFSKFLASRLARQQQWAGAHPDADALTAFAERRLKRGERKPVLTHLAICAECRELLALISEGAPERVEPATKGSAFNIWSLRWAAALAVVFLVTVVVVRRPTSSVQHLTHLADRANVPVATNPASPPDVAPRAKEKPGAKEKASEPREKKNAASRRRDVAPTQPVTTPAGPVSTKEAVTPAANIDSTIPLAAVPPPPFQAMAQRELLPQPQKLEPPSAGASMGFRPQREFARAVGLRSLKKQSLWSVDTNPGMLRRSDNGGQTWASIVVGGQTNFMALSVSGDDVWAGGEAGALFHSTDNGSHWSRVTVSDRAEQLTDTITAIETHSARAVRVRTKLGEWVSSDGGTSWRKE